MFSHTETKFYTSKTFIFLNLFLCTCQPRWQRKISAEPSSTLAIDLELSQSPLKTKLCPLHRKDCWGVTKSTELPVEANQQTNKSYGAPTGRKHKLGEGKKEAHAFLVCFWIKLHSNIVEAPLNGLCCTPWFAWGLSFSSMPLLISGGRKTLAKAQRVLSWWNFLTAWQQHVLCLPGWEQCMIKWIQTD